MKNLKKKGFTIVELVIVIAVIAVLAAVLIPSFVNLTKKANESAYLQERMNQQLQDLIEKVEKQEYLTWEDFEAKLAEELAKANKENADATKVAIEAAIKSYIEKLGDELTGLSEEQVKQIIEQALKGQLTTAQVEAIVKAAIEAIEFPEQDPGVTDAQVSAIVNSAIASLRKEIGDTAITKEQMEKAITDAIKEELKDSLTEEDIKKIVNGALEGFDFGGLTQEEVDKIIADALAKQEAKIEKLIADAIADALAKQEDLTKEDIQQIVSDALAKQETPETITKAEMEQAIADAIEKALAEQEDPLSEEQIKEIINAALAEQEEKIEKLINDAITEALAKQETPETITKEQMEQAIADALAKQENLTAEQVQAIVNEALGKLSCHTEWELLKAVPATCVSDGLTQGLKCKTCEKVVIEQEVIPATGEHNYVEGKCSVCEAEDPNYGFVVYTVEELKTELEKGTNKIILGASLTLEETISINNDVAINLNNLGLYSISEGNSFEIASGCEVVFENGIVDAKLQESCIVFAMSSGVADNKTNLTLNNVVVEASPLDEGIEIYGFDISSYTNVKLDNSTIEMNCIEKTEGNITYSGDAVAVYFNGKSINSTFEMIGGNVTMSGNGSLSFVKSASTYGQANDYNSGNCVLLTGVNVEMRQEKENGSYVIVFGLNNTINKVTVNGGSITIYAKTSSGAYSGAYLNKRTAIYGANNRGFHGTIEYIYTDINLSGVTELELTEDNKNGAFGGTFTINGGVHTSDVEGLFDNWSAEGYNYN